VSIEIARLLFFVFLALFVIAVVFHTLKGRAPHI
jgi:uncharacterized membrane protein YtjA (UPF0391 family)